jgi:UDP-2,3-diacylglucosamine pyrophosphatase LpxH
MSTDEPKRNLLIVSDLHLSEGFSIHEGKFSCLEDFFSDQPFADFLKHHRDHLENERPWRLIIAGDLFDFLQVTALPAKTPAELQAKMDSWDKLEPTAYLQVSEQNKQSRLVGLGRWIEDIRSELQKKSGPEAESQTLENCLNWFDEKRKGELTGRGVWLLEQLVLESWILVNSEELQLPERSKEYGLGTSWQETVWKLDRIAEGHSVFFRALGQFANSGNELFILSGNHDIELFWQRVQERLCQLLGDVAGTAPVQITFLPWIYYEPGLLYLEHGQQYEGANAFENILQPTVPGNEQLIEFPPGSMLVRYLFNKIEEAYPFADNLRPITRFFSWAFENELFKLITIIFRYVGGFLSFAWTFLDRVLWQDIIKNTAGRVMFGDSLAKFKGLNPEANLTNDFLREVDTAAREIRDGFSHRFRTLLLLLFVAFLVLIQVLIILAPFLILLRSEASTLSRNVPLSFVLAILGVAFKQWIAPKLLRIAAGEQYLEEATKRVYKIIKAHAPRPVHYMIFGHNHEPDIIRVISEDSSVWYVNTGSWLYSQAVVEEWLQQTKYHSFLKIIPENKDAAPELRFWNATTKSVEPIRLRYTVPPYKRPKRFLRRK